MIFLEVNFLRSNKVLLDVANERLVYPANTPSPTLRNCNRGCEESVTVNRISGDIMSQSFETHLSPQRGHNITKNLFPYSGRNRRSEINLNNKWNESAKIKIGDLRRYRSNEIKEIVESWKKVVNPDAVQAQPMLLADSASLNLIDNENKEKYYGFAIPKTKVPPKTMQRI